MISVYCDGASSGAKGGAGGYGWVIVRNDEELLQWGYGGSPWTTNNLQELEGAIQGLKALVKLGLKEPAELVSDSQYTLAVGNGSWTPQKNLAEVALLQELVKKTRVRTRWVRGHSGDRWNEVVDAMAGVGKQEHKGTK